METFYLKYCNIAIGVRAKSAAPGRMESDSSTEREHRSAIVSLI